jgi:hypothetical protein
VKPFGRRERDHNPPAHRNVHVHDASWLAWPTLSTGSGGQIKAAGVYYHKGALRSVIARFGSLAMAKLVIELDGEYAGAVRVTVGGKELGSIPHSLAPEFRDAVEQLHRAGLPATCRAALEVDDGDDEEYVDVFLWASPTARSDDEPFLPPSLGSTVQLHEGWAERLDESLHSRAKSKRIAKVGELLHTDGRWGIALDGHPVGTLEPGTYDRVREAGAAGFPLTCRVRIIRELGKSLRVVADLPRD